VPAPRRARDQLAAIFSKVIQARRASGASASKEHDMMQVPPPPSISHLLPRSKSRFRKDVLTMLGHYVISRPKLRVNVAFSSTSVNLAHSSPHPPPPPSPFPLSQYEPSMTQLMSWLLKGGIIHSKEQPTVDSDQSICGWQGSEGT
jgi:hypothetical protein